MKKLLVVIALTVSLGLLAGLCAQPASAFFNGLPFFGNSAKSCGVAVCAPVGYGYYCAPAYACKSVKAKKAKAKANEPVKAKKVKKEKKIKKETK
ncbi:MAG: hypothetical protein ACLPVO_01170 [Desulfomonilaceae bacterium]|jgi:hypothetical protein|nr:hypothetical protein [Syntrophaceae bacterium]